MVATVRSATLAKMIPIVRSVLSGCGKERDYLARIRL